MKKRNMKVFHFWTSVIVIFIMTLSVCNYAGIFDPYTSENVTTKEVVEQTITYNKKLPDTNKVEVIFDSEAVEVEIQSITSSKVSLSAPMNVEETEKKEDIIHIVTEKDSLWSIAQKYFGSGKLYPYIMEYNNLKSKTIIDGQEIRIPSSLDGIEIKTTTTLSTTVSNNNSNGGTKVYSNSGWEDLIKDYRVKNNTDKIDTSNMTYLGSYKITGYDAWCVHCCSKNDGVTASGTQAMVGRTIAMKGLPYGTLVYIEGYGFYIVEDTGGFKPNTIDIACSSHEECYSITNRVGVNVYVVGGGISNV